MNASGSYLMVNGRMITRNRSVVALFRAVANGKLTPDEATDRLMENYVADVHTKWISVVCGVAMLAFLIGGYIQYGK